MHLSINFNPKTQEIQPTNNTTTVSPKEPAIGEILNGGAKVNGIIENFRQGDEAGDCRALAQILGLSYTPIGKKAIQNSVKSDGMGGAIVTFNGAEGEPKNFRISIEEFNSYKNGTIYSKGDDDVLCIEIAMVKYLKSKGVKIPENGLQGVEVAKLGKNELVGLLIGNQVKNDTFFDDLENDNIDIRNSLSKFEENKDNFVCELGFKDFYSEDIQPWHAYSLKKIQNKNDKKFVIIKNPDDTKKDIKIEYELFLSMVDHITLFDLTGKE